MMKKVMKKKDMKKRFKDWELGGMRLLGLGLGLY